MNIDEIEDKLEEALLLYGEDDTKGDVVEEFLFKKTGLILDEAKKMDPLSEKGSLKLKEAVKARKGVEELIGPLITRITAANIDLFDTVLTADQKEDIITGRRSAIGAFRTAYETKYGVGATIYHVDVGGEQSCLEIEWIFVDSMFRRLGVAGFLMCELLYRMTEVEVDTFSVNIPVESRFNPGLNGLFKSWGINVTCELCADIVIDAGDVEEIDKVVKIGSVVGDMSALSDKERSQLVGVALNKFDYVGFLLSKRLPKNYIDYKRSGFIGSPKDPEAIVLVHRMPSGVVRAEYCGYEKGAKKKAAILYTSILQKSMQYSDDELILIPADKEMSLYFDKLCPKRKGRYILTGDISNRG